MKYPYELLIRWNDKGELAGGQIQWHIVLEEGGHTIHSITEPEPISIAGNNGYPLQDVLNIIHIDSIEAMDKLNALCFEKDTIIKQQESKLAEAINIVENAQILIETLVKHKQDLIDQVKILTDEIKNKQDQIINNNDSLNT